MLPTALMSHSAPGRTRIRVPSRKHDRAFFQRAAGELKNLGGVQRMEVNPTTGSILLFHDADITAIRGYAHDHDLFELAIDVKEDIPLVEKVAHRLEALDRKLDESTAGSIDLTSIVFGGLVGLGVLQIFRGEILGPTTTLISDALGILPQVADRPPRQRQARATDRAA